MQYDAASQEIIRARKWLYLVNVVAAVLGIAEKMLGGLVEVNVEEVREQLLVDGLRLGVVTGRFAGVLRQLLVLG